MTAVLLLGVFLLGARGLAPGAAITGLCLGLSIAAPIGPMGVLCIQRTLLTGPHGLPWINRISGALIIAMGGRVLLLALGA